MEKADLTQLADAVANARDLLRKYGDVYVAARLDTLLSRLTAGSTDAIQSALSEATGGMGSLRDRFLCPQNGDAIASSDVGTVNSLLDDHVREIEVCARAAATAIGIHLVG